MKDVGGWISARQGCGKSFNPNKSRWSIRRKMRLRWRSSTSGPSKGKGAPQISRRMTRLRVALEDNSIFGSYWKIASFRMILSILKTISKYLIGSICCGCLLVYYAVFRSDVCVIIAKEISRFEKNTKY